MRKLPNFSIFLVATFFALSSAFAGGLPNLYFDCDGDGKFDSVCNVGANDKKEGSVGIWIGDWDKSSFAGEGLFAATIFLNYNKDQIKVSEAKSFSNDSNHGGPFDSSFSRFQNVGEGQVQLETAAFDCAPITDKLLLFTVGLERIGTEKSDISVKVGYTGAESDGVVIPGGESCSEPHPEDAGGATVQVTAATEPKSIFGKFLDLFK